MPYAKKSLGQHFLHSDSDLMEIARAADIKESDLILEIGPGKGALTKKLLKLSNKVIAVEKDDELFENLIEEFKEDIDNGKLEIIHGDILEFDPTVLSTWKSRLQRESTPGVDYGNRKYKLVANIPYNITGAIIKKLLSADFQPSQMVLLVQKEVAERIVAKDKKESILSLSVKAYGKPKYIKTVKAGSFNPPPKVDSAILSIEGISKGFFKEFSEEKFFEAVRAGFKSKRKKLSSNLSGIYEKKRVLGVFEELRLDPNLRAEDAELQIWKIIGKKLIGS